MKTEIYIIDALRTPIGKFGGMFDGYQASDLASTVVKALKTKHNLKPSDVDHLILGNVLAAGLGQNIARQVLLENFDNDKTAFGINMVCGSGLKAVCLASQSIALGENNLVLAGGTENMSNSPYLLKKARFGYRLGDDSVVDSIVSDGLWDCRLGYHMGQTAENIANKHKISREEQDLFALHSQEKAQKAIASNRFDEEIVAVTIQHRKKEIIHKSDEFPRADTSIEALASLRPAFDKEGSVTAGNTSGINDGAALLLLGSAEAIKTYQPIAKVVSYAEAGVDPSVMGLGPIKATEKALQKANWKISDLDLIESNEAFSVQSIAVKKELSLPDEIINVNGGAIALGHPIGASGARILVTLIHEMKKRQAKKGLATLCIGGGMGIAMCVELI
ncbi:acetyl-CoA C-acyltransferase [Candidatus Marinamargulisbacteria bacterium SCGC AAA071-K20]|nr:acetyl-CoA C-acyltransferase [Candidatus Marinamargulisbacteria bacterium SCGC AAA071-K20]